MSRSRPRTRIAAALGSATVAAALVGAALPQVTWAQIPSLPGIDQLLAPLTSGESAAPELPPLPPLPAPSSAGPGQTPGQVPGFEGIQLPPELSSKPLALPEIPGLDFAPPGPIPGMGLPSGTTYTVQSDSTALTGNVKLSYVTIDTAQGPRPAIRIDADKVVLNNLRVRFPSSIEGIPDQWQRSGPGVITTLTGNFHIIVQQMTVTPQIAGIALPQPLTLNADMASEDLARVLKQVGAGTPDALSEHLVMLNGTMETYYISSDLFSGDVVSIGG